MYTPISIKGLQTLVSICLITAFSLIPVPTRAGTLDISVPLLIDLKEIAPFLEKYAGNDRESSGIHTALGGIYINIGAVDPKRMDSPDYAPPAFGLAEEHLSKAMALNPKAALPNYYMGLLEIHRQDHDRALKHLRKALSLDPKDVRIHQQIHTLYFASYKYATAALFLEDSIKALPKESDLYHRLAATYLAINRLRKSREYAKKALSLSYSPETQNLIATIHIRRKRYLSAEKEFMEVLKRYPENINAMLGIARTYQSRGKPTEALRWIGRALSLERENGEALMLMQEIQGSRQKGK